MKRAIPIVLSAFLLAGCGAHSIQELNGDSAGHAAHGATPSVAPVAGAGKDFNPADVMFLQMMVPHNNQGVKLVKLAQDRAVRPDVKMLAAAIATTQEAESVSMAGWLKEWKQPATAPASEHAGHGGMPGMSKTELDAIANAAPAAFEAKLLNMMIAQQDDAIQMAKIETMAGQNAEAKKLAARVEASRAAQIKQMMAMLGQ